MAAARKREAAPHVQLAELARSLASGAELARAYVLRGNERWFREKAIDLVCAKAEAAGLDVDRHDATGYPKSHEDFELPRLLDDLTARPMFAPARLVVVRGCDALVKKTGGKDSAFTRAVVALLADEAASTRLVLDGESLRADSAVAKAVSKAGGGLLSLRRLWDGAPPWDPDPRKSELVQWLVGHARGRGVRLSADEALFVASATGNDLAALDTQVTRLAASEGRSLREVVGWSGEVNPFKLADDLLAGRGPRAVAGAEALFRSGFRSRDDKRERDRGALSNILLGTVSRKLRQCLLVVEGTSRGLAFDAAADEAGVARGRGRDELRELTRLRPPEAWRGMLSDLVELERRTRTALGVDENHVVLLALRWSRGLAPAARAGRR